MDRHRVRAPSGLSESEAIEAARSFLSADNENAPVWATLAGTYEQVDASLAHRLHGNVAPVRTDTLRRQVWGIQFRVVMEMCGPPGGGCEARDGLNTLIIDYETGDRLGTSGYAPSPGEPLPTPIPVDTDA